MKLRHEEQKTQLTSPRPIAFRAFASAAVLASVISGCQGQPASKELEVKCSPCSNCAVPAESTILQEGVTVRGPGFVSVAIFENKDGSIGAVVSGSVAQHAFSKERMDFEVRPGDICTVLLSGKEQLDIFSPASFVSNTKIVYPSSKRVGQPL